MSALLKLKFETYKINTYKRTKNIRAWNVRQISSVARNINVIKTFHEDNANVEVKQIKHSAN